MDTVPWILTSYPKLFVIMSLYISTVKAWHRQVKKWAVASCKQLITSIVQGIVIGTLPISQFQISQVKQQRLYKLTVNDLVLFLGLFYHHTLLATSNSRSTHCLSSKKFISTSGKQLLDRYGAMLQIPVHLIIIVQRRATKHIFFMSMFIMSPIVRLHHYWCLSFNTTLNSLLHTYNLVLLG